ncbi:MAG: 3-dehydroquinate synthase II [Candidatus Poseidoniaceae archaeon]|jgi:3-dehydroquinate synthase II|tara:strand:- start:943 stop:1971 length:1029 start_codon:yes stop_codon:yes gene_type:complete
MEVWIDKRFSIESIVQTFEGADRMLLSTPTDSNTDIFCDGNRLMCSSQLVGSLVMLDGDASQNYARSLVGSVEWLVLEFSDWSMIPIENLLAACEGTPTKIAAVLSTPEQAQGAGFALQRGVEALVVSPSVEMLEAALIVKSQRLESEQIESNDEASFSAKVGMGKLTITSVESGGTAERYCIDMTRLLKHGEGLLLGSSASSFLFVHGETVESEFVPTRPFRVNAGPPHAYVRMSNGNTKYLSELHTGDEVLLVNTEGMIRSATIGRLKIEIRPMLLIKWLDENDKEGSMFLQQAETVRVVGLNNKTKSITALKEGEIVLGWCDVGARHIGASISSIVTER